MDERDIFYFSVRHPESAMGLERYIKYYAYSDEDLSVMRTYVIRDIETDELVAYFSLKAGLVSINERTIESEDDSTFDTIPGVEIANFAINESYRKKHDDLKGIGIDIFRHFIQKIVKSVSETVGVRLLYIFALHNRIKPYYDRSCIFMYQLI
jgi:hypothetical protein